MYLTQNKRGTVYLAVLNPVVMVILMTAMITTTMVTLHHQFVCVRVRARARANFGSAGAQNQTLLFEMEKALLAADSGKFSFISLCPKLI
jgi:hypothetical protein